MGDLGWRAKSSQITRQPVAIEGLREDFGVRTKSAITAMKEAGTERSTQDPKKGRGRLEVLQNKGVAARAQRDLEELEDDESKELKRLGALEEKSKLYDRMQRGVDLEDEAGNSRHEVDFIGKALQEGQDMEDRQPGANSAWKPTDPIGADEMLEQQRVTRNHMQGGEPAGEYSTYAEDTAELKARFQRVDELNELNATRGQEFSEAEEREQERMARKRKEASSHKNAILQKLLQKRQRLKAP